MPLRLYQSDLSPYAARVRILAHAKGLKLEAIPPLGGALKSEAYLAVNPLGKIPCLEHDGTILPESEVICEYLEDSFPSPTLRPVDPAARARVRLLSRMGDVYLAPPLTRLFAQLNPKTRDTAAVDAAWAELQTALSHVGHFLEGPDYAAGSRLSLADCTLMPLLFFVEGLLVPSLDKKSPLNEKMRVYYDAALNDTHIARAIAEMKIALEQRMKQQAAS